MTEAEQIKALRELLFAYHVEITLAVTLSDQEEFERWGERIVELQERTKALLGEPDLDEFVGMTRRLMDVL